MTDKQLQENLDALILSVCKHRSEKLGKLHIDHNYCKAY